jgi:hypothetical protein
MAFGSLALPAFFAGLAAALFRPENPLKRRPSQRKARDDFQLWPELAQVCPELTLPGLTPRQVIKTLITCT